MHLDYKVDDLLSLLSASSLNKHILSQSFRVRNVIIDTRNPALTSNSLFVALSGSKDNGHVYLEDFAARGGKIALVSEEHPHLQLAQIVVPDPLLALQQIATHHRSSFAIPVIAITGSNGKTIVKEWLYHVLKDVFAIVRSPKSYNSQIGVALSLLEINKTHTLGIFEAGISKTGEMERLESMIQPTLGVFTGIGDAHSANFASIDEKKQEKYKLYKRVSKIVEPSHEQQFHLPFSDDASQKNASVVWQVAKLFGLKEDQIYEKLKTLPAISMRLEQIEGKNNCLILNDAYSADIQSLEIALRQLQITTKNSHRVLFLTPFADADVSQANSILPDLVSPAFVNEVIFIGSTSEIPAFKIPSRAFSSADEFLKSGIQFERTTLLFKGSRKFALERIVQAFTARKHVTRLTINLTSLRNNLNYFRSKLQPATKILAMVKAQSYGGGLVEMAHFLVSQKVNYFGVAYADEGVALRKSGITLPIIVMNPEQSAFDEIIDYNLEPSIYAPELLHHFVSHLILRGQQNFPIHIKLDTGMNRLGFTEDQLPDLLDTLHTQPEVYVKSVFSHLSAADDESEHQFTSNQIRTFDILTGVIADSLSYTFDRHLANSAGAVNFNRAEYDMIRLGIGLFGLLDKTKPALENVLSLTTQISQIKIVKAGESVGYGRTYIATHDHAIGIIPVGYADGLNRGLSQGNWSVRVRGKLAPIIGNICMDMCMIHLEGIDARVGDDVEIFGDTNSIFDMALNLKTIPYEIIAGISTRVHRVYVDE